MRAASISHLRMLRSRTGHSLLAGLALVVVGIFVLALAPAEARAEGPATSHSRSTAPQVGLVENDETLAARFIGFIYGDDQGHLATRIRAVGLTARGEIVNCGTTDIDVTDNGFGFYNLLVLGQAAREGCPKPGDPVSFRLLSGSIDDGVRADTSNDTTFIPGSTSVVTLSPTIDSSVADRWAGDASGKITRLTWIGSDHTTIADALAALDRLPIRVWRWDESAGRFLVYVPDGPASQQTLLTINHQDRVGFRFE